VVVLAGDLVLKVSEETSLLLLLLTVFIGNPFLIFKEVAILLEGLVNMSGGSSMTCTRVGLSYLGSSGGVSTSSSVYISINVSSGSSVSLGTFLDDNGFVNNFSDDWLAVGCLNDSLFDSLVNLSSFHFFVDLVGVGLVDNRNVLFFNHGGVFLMDHWLVVLVDMLFNDHWLMMFMNNILMMLMNYIFVMFHNDILVVLVDHILVNFFHDGSIDVSLDVSGKFVLLNYFTFIGLLVHCLFFVSDHDGFFVNLLNNNVSTSNGVGSSSKTSFSVSVS